MATMSIEIACLSEPKPHDRFSSVGLTATAAGVVRTHISAGTRRRWGGAVQELECGEGRSAVAKARGILIHPQVSALTAAAARSANDRGSTCSLFYTFDSDGLADVALTPVGGESAMEVVGTHLVRSHQSLAGSGWRSRSIARGVLRADPYPVGFDSCWRAHQGYRLQRRHRIGR